MSNEETKVIVEDVDGNFVQVHFDDEGNPDWYDVFLIEWYLCFYVTRIIW